LPFTCSRFYKTVQKPRHKGGHDVPDDGDEEEDEEGGDDEGDKYVRG
jgi:hypothetical protein